MAVAAVAVVVAASAGGRPYVAVPSRSLKQIG